MARRSKNGKGKVTIVASFRHYRSGKIIKAADYGLKGFPIPARKRKG